ncbi:DUF6542 domain-containing protein [Gordonia terrae]|uniref:DUF6542 domain-containing protein n=1 Tax=Gordonia terrae TaxID=2055 RepID=UPI003F6B0290
MSSPQRLQTAVPLDQQSVLPAVRGVPWWGAVLLGTGITGLGAAIDAGSNDSLGSIYKFCYLVGCVIAALAVRRRALFTAAAQPPLIAFFVSIVTLYGLNSEQASSGLKSLIFNVLLPIAADFPWMATTFVVTLALVMARWFLTRDGNDAAKRRSPSRASAGRRDDERPGSGRANSHRRAKGATAAGTASTGSTKSGSATAKSQPPKAQGAKPQGARSQAAKSAGAKSAGSKSAAPKSQATASRAPAPRTDGPTDRPSTTARQAGRTTSAGARRPTVAELGAADLTPSDAPPTDRRRPDIPRYESATDVPPAGVADSRP